MRRRTCAFLAAAMLVAPEAWAQRLDKDGVPYRAWDLNASVGVHVVERRDAGGVADAQYGDSTNGNWAFGFDIGRYWTSHLKTELGLILWPGWNDYTQQPFVAPNGARGYTSTSSRIEQTQVSFAGTWQFLENTFAHPYLTAGARVGFLDVREVGSGIAWVPGQSASYPVPPFERESSDVVVRPYVAGGFKSYFNERVFTRPEFAVAFNSGGPSQWTTRLGFGVDF